MALAQTITTGDTVKDTTGAVVPGATITLRSTDFGDTRTRGYRQRWARFASRS
jgi:hypothetical protein